MSPEFAFSLRVESQENSQRTPDFILNPEFPDDTGYYFQSGGRMYRKVQEDFLYENSRTGLVFIKGVKTPESVCWQHPVRQALLCASLHHPNIVRFFDLVHMPEYLRAKYELSLYSGYSLPYGRLHEIGIVMEYVNGQNILEYVKLLRGEKIIPIFEQIISVFRYLDRLHIVHGDIKPENILVNEDGVVKLTDFDTIYRYDPQNPKGKIGAGTYPYSPQEQFEESYIDKVDVHALAMLIKALIEKKPQRQYTWEYVPVDSILNRSWKMTPHPDFQSLFDDRATTNLSLLILKGTGIKAESRPSMCEFLDEFEELVNQMKGASQAVASGEN